MKKEKPRLRLWSLRISSVLLGLTLIALALFWSSPLHWQARLPWLGEWLSERPTLDDRANAEDNPTEHQLKPRPKTQEYFPDRTFKLAADGTSFLEVMLAEALKGLGEEPLYPKRADPMTHVYRLTWSRSFDPVVVVQFEVQPDGSGSLISKHFGLRPVGKGKVTTREKSLSKKQVSALSKRIENSGFWDVVADDDVYGIDGSTWLIEGCRGGKYHVVKRETPKNGNLIKELGLTMLEDAGIWRGPVY